LGGAEDVEAATVRQRDVEQHEIGLDAPVGIERARQRSGARYFEPLAFEIRS